jgi:hypothetical protein
MTYKIEVFGDQSTTGIPSAPYNSPNFPPNYPAGEANLVFGSDLQCDPAETDSVCDPNSGWDSPGKRVSEI